MKVKEAAKIWLDYHKTHSKKKYGSCLWIDSIQSLYRTWRHPYTWYRCRYDPVISSWTNQRKKAWNQKSPIRSPVSLFQFYQKRHCFRFEKSMWFTNAQKIIPSYNTPILGFYWKGNDRWNHFPNDQNTQSFDTWINGSGWYEDRRGAEIDIQGH